MRISDWSSDVCSSDLRAQISRPAVGLSLTIFAGVNVERHSQEMADAFVAAVLDISGVIACHMVSGGIDFLLEVVAVDMASYEKDTLRELLSLPVVRSVHSNFEIGRSAWWERGGT